MHPGKHKHQEMFLCPYLCDTRLHGPLLPWKLPYPRISALVGSGALNVLPYEGIFSGRDLERLALYLYLRNPEIEVGPTWHDINCGLKMVTIKD